MLKLITYFNKNPHKNVGGIGAKAEATRLRLLEEIDSLGAEQAQLSEKMGSIDKARIEIGTALYDGVEVRIGNQVWQVLDEIGAGTVLVRDGKITVRA
ncbi:FapA family protein [Undibacterium arcticum]